MKTVKNEYIWMLQPITKKNKEIRDKAKIKDARRAGVNKCGDYGQKV